MILQVEAAVHVVDAVRDLVLVRHHAQVERLRSFIQYQLQNLQIQLGQLRLNPPKLGVERFSDFGKYKGNVRNILEFTQPLYPLTPL